MPTFTHREVEFENGDRVTLNMSQHIPMKTSVAGSEISTTIANLKLDQTVKHRGQWLRVTKLGSTS